MVPFHYTIDARSCDAGGGYVVHFMDRRGVEVGASIFPWDGVVPLSQLWDEAHDAGVAWVHQPVAAVEPVEPVEPVKRGRGRPRLHASAADRQAAYAARKGVSVTVLLPPDLADALNAYMSRNQADGAVLTKSGVIERLLRTQLLRKR